MALYGYIRVVSSELSKSGLSLSDQRAQLETWTAHKGLGLFDQIFEDANVSGGTELHDREAGRELLDVMTQGDVVVVTRLDRMFRNALAAVTIVENFKQRGVELHVTDLQTDIAGSDLFRAIMSSVTEWERSLASERQKESKREMSSKGRFLGGRKKTGVKRVARDDGKAYAEKDENEQRAINYIRHHKDRELKVLQDEIEKKFGVVKSIPTLSRIRKDAAKYQTAEKAARWKGDKGDDWKARKQARKKRGKAAK